jgi:hypothetical protein
MAIGTTRLPTNGFSRSFFCDCGGVDMHSPLIAF